MFISYIYFYDNFELKKNVYISLSILVLLSILEYFMNYLNHNNFIINMIFFVILNIIYSKITFNVSYKDSIFHSLLLAAIILTTEVLVEAAESSLFHIPIDAYKNNIAVLIISGILCKLLCLIICKLLSSLFSYKKSNKIKDMKKSFILILYPVMTMVILALFLYASAKYSFSDYLNLAGVIISLISIVLCCFIFIFNQTIQKQEYELISLQSENQKNEINRTFYELLEKNNENQRILVHDIKHHLSSLSSMNNIEDVKKYLANIQYEFDEYQYIGKSKNKMLDLILGKYSHICKTNNINFIVDVRSSNLSFIEDNDLSSLLGNLLDNAVEATKSIENSEISLVTKKGKNFDFISVVNSCDKPPKKQGNKLLTTKSNALFHGYGVKSIEKIANKYNGICNWEYKEDDKTFHFNIIFNKNTEHHVD